MAISLPGDTRNTHIYVHMTYPCTIIVPIMTILHVADCRNNLDVGSKLKVMLFFHFIVFCL